MKMPLHPIFKHPLKSALLFMVLALLLTWNKTTTWTMQQEFFSSADPAPYSSTKAKGSLYNGGVHALLFRHDRKCLIVSGYGVGRQGEEEEALVTAVDLYNTFLAAANLSPEENLDSQSFWPLVASAGKGRALSIMPR